MKKIIVNEKNNIIKEQEVIESNKDDFTLEEVDNHYVTRKGKKYKVEFASIVNEENLMTINKDNCALKMNFLGKKRRMKRVKSSIGKIKENKVIYEEIEEGLDLSYLCQESKIKESIIIKTRQDNYDYDFTMDIGELTPRFNEKEHVLELVKDNKSVYRILSPYMEDSNKQRSEDCSYSIEQSGSLLTLHLHCDSKWINDETRLFPIIVDPTIEMNQYMDITYTKIINGV